MFKKYCQVLLRSVLVIGCTGNGVCSEMGVIDSCNGEIDNKIEVALLSNSNESTLEHNKSSSNDENENKNIDNQKQYIQEEIEEFIDKIRALDVTKSGNFDNAIELGYKAFWGSEELANEAKEVTKEINLDDYQKRVDNLLQNREIGSESKRVALRMMVWCENAVKWGTVKKTDTLYKEGLFWSAISAKFHLPQGVNSLNYFKYHLKKAVDKND